MTTDGSQRKRYTVYHTRAEKIKDKTRTVCTCCFRSRSCGALTNAWWLGDEDKVSGTATTEGTRKRLKNHVAHTLSRVVAIGYAVTNGVARGNSNMLQFDTLVEAIGQSPTPCCCREKRGCFVTKRIDAWQTVQY